MTRDGRLHSLSSSVQDPDNLFPGKGKMRPEEAELFALGMPKAGETVRPVRSSLLRQIHLTQQRSEARVAIEWHKRRVYFDEQ
jgi:hypothetical protein